MTKKEYLKQIKELREIITQTLENVKRIKSEYIAENAKYQKGQKVQVYNYAEKYTRAMVLIDDIFTGDKGDISYSLREISNGKATHRFITLRSNECLKPLDNE